MDKRKVIILAIVLFLFIGLGTFVFAQNGSDENGNGQGNNTIDTPDNNGGDNGQDTPSGTEDDGETEEGGNTGTDNTTTAGGNGENEQPGEEPNTPNEPTTPNEPETPENPDTPVDNTKAELLAALKAIQEKIDNADALDDIDSARVDRTDELVSAVEELDDAELNDLLDEINRVLDDSTKPLITPEDLDGSYNNATVAITISDDTATNYTLTLNGDPVENPNLDELTEEGTYTLTVTDEAFNETTITFTIDKTNPVLLVNGSKVENDDVIYVNKDAKMTVDEDNLESFTSNGIDITKALINNGYWTAQKDGEYNIEVTDKAGNKTTYKVVVDKTPIAVNHLYVLNNTHNDYNVSEENRYKVVGNGQELYFEYVLKEEFASTPKLTIGGKEYKMTCDVASWNDELYKCDAHVTISKDMNLVNGEVIPFTITGVKDIAGNETVVTEKDTTVSDKYGKVKFDKEAAESIWVYILNTDENNRTVIGNNQKLIVEINVDEELLVNPVITIGKYQAELTRRANDSRYIYSKTITIDADEMNLVHNKNIAFTISVTDVAGNTTTLDNNNVTVHEENGYNQVKYDGKAPKYKQLGVLNVDHLRNDEDVTVAKTGDEIRVLFHFDEILDVNPKMTIGESKTVYELKLATDYENFAEYTYMADITLTEDMNLSDGALVYTIYGYADAAGNVGKTIKSTDEIKTYTKFPGVRIDNAIPEITVDELNDNGYTNNGNVNIADASNFDVVVKIDGEVRHEYSNTKRADLSWLGDGEYEIIVTDAAGNSNTIKFNLDTVAAQKHAVYLWANTESVVENIDGKDYVVYYVTNGDVVTATISVNEILGENPKFVIGYNGGSYEVPQDQVIFRELDDVEDFKYVYSAQITIPEDVTTENTELTLTVYNVVDQAGNVTNNGEAIGISNVNRIFVDTVAPEIEVYKNSKVDDANNVTSLDKYNYYVGIKANDEFIKSVTVNGEEYDLDKMPAFGVSNDIKTYEVVAYDKAGNESTKTFTIDTKKPIVVVNDTEYTGEESVNNFIDIGRFDSVNVNILEENIKYVNVWYNGVLQEDYLNVDYTQEGTYQIEVRDEFSNKTKIEFYVGKYDSKIVFSGLDNIVYDGNPVDDITVDVVDSEGNKVEQPILVNYYKDSYGEGNLLTGAPTDAGTYVIAAYYQKDNGDYEIAWASAEFTIKQAIPTIELTEPDNLYFDETQKEYGIKVIGVNGEIESPRMNVVYKDRVTSEDLETAPTKIGKYTLGIYVGPSQNYTRADKWINFEIVENPDHVT